VVYDKVERLCAQRLHFVARKLQGCLLRHAENLSLVSCGVGSIWVRLNQARSLLRRYPYCPLSPLAPFRSNPHWTRVR
jgi:hypothetical protein